MPSRVLPAIVSVSALPGVNFLDVCAAAAWVGVADAAAALEGITLVCTGRRPDFTLEYRSDVTGDERWSLMT